MLFNLVSLILLATVAAAADVQFDWVFTKTSVKLIGKNRGLEKDMITIDGTWPPRAVVVNKGDKMVVNVTNNYHEPITLHAHGFLQKDNNVYDGPEGITQCPIEPDQNFIYHWTAEEPGTFWIHSHHPSQYPHGLRFPLIVKDAAEPTKYVYSSAPEKDIILDMSDTYYTQPQWDVDAGYLRGDCGPGLEPPPSGVVIRDWDEPDGLNLINAGPKSGRLRIRLINMSAFSTMMVFLSNQIPFRVMEIDSVPMDRDYMPIAKAIELNAGQRMSIIVDLDNDVSRGFKVYASINPYHFQKNNCAQLKKNNYAYTATSSITFTNDNEPPRPPMTFTQPPNYSSPGGTAYDNTRLWINNDWKFDNLPVWANKYLSYNDVVSESWYWDKLKPSDSVSRIPFKKDGPLPTKLIQIDFTATNANSEFASLNNAQFTIDSSTSILLQALRPLPTCSQPSQIPKPLYTSSTLGPETFYSNPGGTTKNTITLALGQTVYMVLISRVGSHTFHMHGHNFQVLYTQPENEAAHELAIPDLERLMNNDFIMPGNPLRRDTLFVTTKTVAVVAFTADNPGAWFFHCHNDFHALSGMAGVFVTVPDGGLGSGDLNKKWGKTSFDQCGGSAMGHGDTLTSWPKTCNA